MHARGWGEGSLGLTRIWDSDETDPVVRRLPGVVPIQLVVVERLIRVSYAQHGARPQPASRRLSSRAKSGKTKQATHRVESERAFFQPFLHHKRPTPATTINRTSKEQSSTT